MPPQSPAEKPKLQLIDDETRSLFQLGFIVPIDFVFAGILVFVGFTALIWIISARPDFVYIMAILLCLHFVATIWSITLIYRACYFVLKMRAVMETMPETAAQIAVKIHEQRLSTVAGATTAPTPMPAGKT